MLEFELATPPTPGITRVRRKFAWFPKNVGNYILWLGKYEMLEAYIVTEHRINIEGKWQGAMTGKWIEISRRII